MIFLNQFVCFFINFLLKVCCVLMLTMNQTQRIMRVILTWTPRGVFARYFYLSCQLTNSATIAGWQPDVKIKPMEQRRPGAN